MKRLLIFGDSILRGVYVSEDGSRHRLYRERLDNLSAGGLEVRNCSVMGATVSTGADLIRRKLPETEDPDDCAVIFEYGGNDCDYKWQDISDHPDGHFTPNTPADRFVTRYGDCIGYARRTGAKVFLCNLIPLDAERYLDWISRNLSRENILAWLGDTGRLCRWQEYYSRTAEEIAGRFGCPLIDLRSPFLLFRDRTDLLSPDGIHPTVEGHRVIDTLIKEAITA